MNWPIMFFCFVLVQYSIDQCTIYNPHLIEHLHIEGGKLWMSYAALAELPTISRDTLGT